MFISIYRSERHCFCKVPKIDVSSVSLARPSSSETLARAPWTLAALSAMMPRTELSLDWHFTWFGNHGRKMRRSISAVSRSQAHSNASDAVAPMTGNFTSRRLSHLRRNLKKRVDLILQKVRGTKSCWRSPGRRDKNDSPLSPATKPRQSDFAIPATRWLRPNTVHYITSPDAVFYTGVSPRLSRRMWRKRSGRGKRLEVHSDVKVLEQVIGRQSFQSLGLKRCCAPHSLHWSSALTDGAMRRAMRCQEGVWETHFQNVERNSSL